MLDVYTWEPNMNAGKPLLALEEKGVEFSYHYVDLAKREQHAPWFLEINPNGTVKGIEIMDYRESYGYEVREASWRAQFVGKSSGSALKVDQDIRNISGATLSSHHVTEGVKRVVAAYGNRAR